MRGIKQLNEYANEITSYRRIPKSVLAAVAFSFASRIVESGDSPAIESAILAEWQVLFDNGIVPQEPK